MGRSWNLFWIQAQGGTVIYTGDLIPGLPWVNLPITTGYDRFAERLVDEKKQMLDRATAQDALLVFPHDAVHAAARVEFDPVKKTIQAVNSHGQLFWIKGDIGFMSTHYRHDATTKYYQ